MAAAPSANEAAQLIRAKDTQQAASTFQQMTDHVGISPEGVALFHANDYINAMDAFRTHAGPRSIENAVWEAACVYGREGRVKARGRAGVGALGEGLVDGSGGRSEEALAMVHELFRGRQSSLKNLGHTFRFVRPASHTRGKCDGGVECSLCVYRPHRLTGYQPTRSPTESCSRWSTFISVSITIASMMDEAAMTT